MTWTTCWKCKESVDPDKQFCSSCGARQGFASRDDPPAARPSTNQAPLVIAILVAALLVAGVIWFTSHSDDACKKWQADVQSLAPTYDASLAAVIFGDERPEGCPTP